MKKSKLTATSRISTPAIVKPMTGFALLPVTLKRTSVSVCVATNSSEPLGGSVPLKAK